MNTTKAQLEIQIAFLTKLKKENYRQLVFFFERCYDFRIR